MELVRNRIVTGVVGAAMVVAAFALAIFDALKG